MDKDKRAADIGAGLVREVKDLLCHMDPMIYLAGTADNTSEMLAYLPDMDPAFHKLHLVKNLRKTMRDDLSNMIEGHIDTYLKEQTGKMRSENPVDHLVEKVTSDNSYNYFMKDARESVERSVQHISDNFDDEIVTGMFGDDDTTFTGSPNDSNESSLNSSLNQSGLLFLHPSQYFNVAQNFTNKKEYESWHDSLNILLAVTPGEPVMQESWPDIRKGLKECLFDDSIQIFDKALKVHSKILTSQVHSAVKEAYLNLLDTLAGFYMSKHLLNKVPVRGEEINLKSHENVLRILKVLIEFQRELPLLWIRYPERYVDDMVEGTFNLLALNLSSKAGGHMSVWELYCIIDPDASWLRKWVHGRWGRTKTFAAMRSNFLVLLHSVSCCIQHLDNDVSAPPSVNSSLTLIPALLSHLQFLQSCNIVMAALSYADGRKLFPVNVPSKDELVTIQGIFQIFIKALNRNISKVHNLEISKLIKKFCSQDEGKCMILCEAGTVELLIQEVSKYGMDDKSEEELNLSVVSSYIEAVLIILESVLTTEVGQKYVLLGRKRKSSSKSGLVALTSSPATQVLNLVYILLKSKQTSSTLKKLGLDVCCQLLSSPVGVHICVEHPLMNSFLEHLKERQRNVCDGKLPHGHDPTTPHSISLSVPQSLPLLNALLLSHKGVFLLEREGVLSLALTQVLQELARNGRLNSRILATVCSSVQGCRVVGKLRVMEPFWDMLCELLQGNEPVAGVSQQQQLESDTAIEEATLPLLTLLATHQGTRLLFKDSNVGEELVAALISGDEILPELHSIALHLLAAATSVLDSVVFLQHEIHFQELLLGQQNETRSGPGDDIIVDENSVLRNHILVKTHLLGGCSERYLPPLTLHNTQPQPTPQLFSHYPPPREYIPEKPIRSVHKKQNEVWRFLTETRHGLHDSGWLMHCRKAVRSVLASGNDIKSWLVIDILERCVRAHQSSSEELLPGCPSPSATPSPTTSPTTNPISWWGSPTSQSPTFRPASPTSASHCLLSAPQAAAVDLVLRYGGELQLLIASPSVRENLTDILKYTQQTILHSSSEECDWFTMVIFLVSGGNLDKCGAVVLGLSRLVVGGVLWPALANALTTSHHISAGEMTWAGIIHNVQLILNIEIPTLFLALQKTDSWVWGMVGEWVQCVFLSVLPWSEVCHYLVLVLMQGSDWIVYFLVALLRHLHPSIISHSSSRSSLTHLQTSVISGWRAGDHLTFMEALCRRHRRTVLPDLTRPLHARRYHYTPKQL